MLALLKSILNTEILIPEKVLNGNLLLQVWLLLYIAFVGFEEAATTALFRVRGGEGLREAFKNVLAEFVR